MEVRPVRKIGRTALVPAAVSLAVMLLSLFLLAAFSPPAACGGSGTDVGTKPAEVSSTDLIENPDRYNGETVVYVGEVVVEILDRGDYAWITVNDDHYARRHLHRYEELKGGNSGIGVYCGRDMLGDVTHVGTYKTAGDLVRVTGTFYRSNPEHGGDLMIEADSISVVRDGYDIDHSGPGAKLLWLAGMAAVSLVLGWLLYNRLKTPPGH